MFSNDALAFPVLLEDNQCKDGETFEVIIFIISPFLSDDCNGSFPLISQLTAVSPILVRTAYAKSIGVASLGNFITAPFGVKQKRYLETFVTW